MKAQRGKKQKKSKGRKSCRQVNLENRLNAYAKLVEDDNFNGNHNTLPKRFGGFTRPGSGKRT